MEKNIIGVSVAVVFIAVNVIITLRAAKIKIAITKEYANYFWKISKHLIIT